MGPRRGFSACYVRSHQDIGVYEHSEVHTTADDVTRSATILSSDHRTCFRWQLVVDHWTSAFAEFSCRLCDYFQSVILSRQAGWQIRSACFVKCEAWSGYYQCYGVASRLYKSTSIAIMHHAKVNLTNKQSSASHSSLLESFPLYRSVCSYLISIQLSGIQLAQSDLIWLNHCYIIVNYF